MASEVDVVDALRECAEAWEPDVCVLGNVQARDVVAVCERLREAERERDARVCQDGHGNGVCREPGAACAEHYAMLRRERDEALAAVRDGFPGIVSFVRERLRAAEAARDEWARQCNMTSEREADLLGRVSIAEKGRDQARERESYALAAIERNDEVHAEAIRAVRQRAERAEQTRDAHAEALAQAARDAGDLLDRIAALTVERDDARSLLAHAERAIEQGTGDCLLVDHLKRALMERDEARAALIRSQEDHRAAVEALETYEERIGDIADHVLGLVPPDVPSIVKLDAIERRCGEERVAARQAERERDEARAEVDKLHTITLDVMRERDAAREAGRRVGREDVAKYANAIGRIESLFGLVGPVSMRETVATVERELAQLRAVRDAAEALVGADYPPSWSVFKPLVDALAARGEDGGA